MQNPNAMIYKLIQLNGLLNHQATMPQGQVVFCRACITGEKVDVKASSTVRTTCCVKNCSKKMTYLHDSQMHLGLN